MGESLRKPVTKLSSESGENNYYKYGLGGMQGWRKTMEDAHSIRIAFDGNPSSAFFGVFDGHGGGRTSNFAGENLADYIFKRPEFKEGKIEEALIHGFEDLDAQMKDTPEIAKESSGSTAITVLIKDGVLYCANLGDSRAFACRNATAVPLSKEHNCGNVSESKRFKEKGDSCTDPSDMTRFFGNFDYKKSIYKGTYTAEPEVITQKITPDLEFVVLECDGISNNRKDQELIDFIRPLLGSGVEPVKVCEEVINDVIAKSERDSSKRKDNMSILIVCCTQGQPYKDYIQKFTVSI